ncbi:hypothetical protein MAR_005194 [Mya arenaria]|uniref:Uncharacterized protein n=1 Tax=Mya arenaria TaxID=6604 RepID=A0ABY7F181_MYAAR|nr:hypothetical protein MAR_005194 [Mya arenaria]
MDNHGEVHFSNKNITFTAVTHVNPYSDRRRDSNLENDGITIITSKRQRDAANETKTIEATVDNTNQSEYTAVMLFVVTVVFFLLRFVWLAHGVVSDRVLPRDVLHAFCIHTANLFIYAFMNKSFRDDIG